MILDLLPGFYLVEPYRLAQQARYWLVELSDNGGTILWAFDSQSPRKYTITNTQYRDTWISLRFLYG
jgi:hypothetical protein